MGSAFVFVCFFFGGWGLEIFKSISYMVWRGVVDLIGIRTILPP